ncbi:acyl-coenzyme A diphosphatase NUDT19-like [Watersipora subatra]|uniref:acyl-coenzyme A diphosphatase NUDT19-like n=1 Tax=Watersipora subatra TaxID=2589382 RepID=UPI00355B52CD
MTSLAKCPTHNLWKKSAAILLIGPGKKGCPAVLTVKRSKKAKFMPTNLVFPGGLCEASDFSLSWLDTFPQLRSFAVNPHATFPDIFINDAPEQAQLQELSPHVGFRITAIRELVEETGLMMDEKSGKALPVPDNIRKQIHEEPKRFCEILKSLNMSPDIFSLHNWSTWLTPLGLKHSSRRYDTQFYVAVVDNIEHLNPTSDNAEVSTVQFWDIGEILKAALAGSVLVAPVQMYELSRLLSFKTIDAIREYAQSRDRLGTERIFTVKINCSDGAIWVLPGDSLYPEDPDYMGTDDEIFIPKTVEECMQLYPKHHRMVSPLSSPLINISLNLEQVTPTFATPRSQL